MVESERKQNSKQNTNTIIYQGVCVVMAFSCFSADPAS